MTPNPCHRVLTCFAFSLIALLSAGCGTTNYQSMGAMGGAGSVREPDDIFRIDYHHNSAMDPRTAEDYTLLKSAETALENGYLYFSVLGSTSPRTSIPPGTLGVTTRTWHTIKCFKKKPIDLEGLVHNARELSQTLRQKHHLPERFFWPLSEENTESGNTPSAHFGNPPRAPRATLEDEFAAVELEETEKPFITDETFAEDTEEDDDDDDEEISAESPVDQKETASPATPVGAAATEPVNPAVPTATSAS